MIWTLYNFLGPTCTYLFLIYELRWKIRTFWRTVLIRDKIRKFCETAPVFPSTSVVLCSVNRPTFLLPLFPQLPLVINQSQLQDLFHEFPTGSQHRKIAKHVSDNICTATYCTYVQGIKTLCLKKGRPIYTNYIKSSFESVDLQIQLGNITPVICVPSGLISSTATTTLVGVEFNAPLDTVSWRRSSQTITWLILTNKTVQENADKQTQCKSEKVDNLKYSKTKLPLFNTTLGQETRWAYSTTHPTTTTFLLRLSGENLSVVVTRQWCYGPSRLWANDDDNEQKLL